MYWLRLKLSKFHLALIQHISYPSVFVAKFLTAEYYSFQERGLKQALLARGSEEDLTCLLDQLGNYQFQHITHLSSGSSEMAFGETLR